MKKLSATALDVMMSMVTIMTADTEGSMCELAKEFVKARVLEEEEEELILKVIEAVPSADATMNVPLLFHRVGQMQFDAHNKRELDSLVELERLLAKRLPGNGQGFRMGGREVSLTDRDSYRAASLETLALLLVKRNSNKILRDSATKGFGDILGLTFDNNTLVDVAEKIEAGLNDGSYYGSELEDPNYLKKFLVRTDQLPRAGDLQHVAQAEAVEPSKDEEWPDVVPKEDE